MLKEKNVQLGEKYYLSQPNYIWKPVFSTFSFALFQDSNKCF